VEKILLNWQPPSKPAELTENRLIAAFLDGTFPVDSNLPAERELATRLGVTRPTLREALQRLARDGWLEIRQGKPTRIRNYWQEGSLAVLAAIARREENPPADFVPNLLSVRVLLAPAYTRLAVEKAPASIVDLLRSAAQLTDDPSAFSAFDWQLHRQLTICSGNPVFTLILNGFQNLYLEMGTRYFSLPRARQSSRGFYRDLLAAARNRDGASAAALAGRIMQESLGIWNELETKVSHVE
jgi:GntR family negative regulator for fad regulon and positive regulator of fabA